MFRSILFAILGVSLANCASTTMIKSDPSGGKLYIDGSLVGKTPYTYSDTKVVGSTTQIRIKKDGCEDFHGVLTRSEKFEIGPCIGGALVLVPFLWVMGYNPVHHYELECDGRASMSTEPSAESLAFVEAEANMTPACMPMTTGSI